MNNNNKINIKSAHLVCGMIWLRIKKCILPKLSWYMKGQTFKR